MILIIFMNLFLLKKNNNIFLIRVHRGWYFGYREVQALVQKTVYELSQKLCPLGGCDVICTGHSLGAALSVFAAQDLAAFSMASNSPSLQQMNVSLMNFGQPRTGNIAWAQLLNQSITGIFRLVNNHDIVPHVPPRHSPFNYFHPPYEVWELANQTYLVCNSSGEDPHCSDSLKPWQLRPADHDIYMSVPNNNCGT